MLTTDQKGAIAEMAVAWEATKLGVEVYRPVFEGGRFDMIFLLGEHLVRIQCKWATRQGDVVVVRCYSNRRTRDGLERRLYTAQEIDAFAVYCAELEKCFFLPYERFPNQAQIFLRLAPSRNNQRELVNWARDYEFAVTLGPQGAIAQLGERRHGMAEVVGSSPTGSTPSSAA